MAAFDPNHKQDTTPGPPGRASVRWSAATLQVRPSLPMSGGDRPGELLGRARRCGSWMAFIAGVTLEAVLSTGMSVLLG